MKRPKNCNNCRAFWQSQWRYNCSLGYKLNITKIGEYKGLDIVNVKPEKGECPKPLSNKELINVPKAYEIEVDNAAKS